TDSYFGHRIHRMKERSAAGTTSHGCASTSLRSLPNPGPGPEVGITPNPGPGLPPHLATHRLLRLLPWRGAARPRIPPSPGVFFSVAVDSAGNLYVADTDNHIIRKAELWFDDAS